ncbi:anti-sigma factor [Mycobacterium sp. M26]|uniref:anti-sigma factor n=1 Tax=Mycobacterium sp. M26 TaxID=1762962 RepID=UPI001E4CF4C7|nr:anti-sigma factor [Mycobacterium sp. M26]
MARVSAVSAEEPPAELRGRLLAAVADDNVRTLPTAATRSTASADTGKRWRGTVLTAAAAVVIGADDNVRTLPTAATRSTASADTGKRWRGTVLTAAAAVVIGLGAVAVVQSMRPEPAQPSTAQQVFAAPDVHTISGDIPGGGTATVVFSRDKNAGVLVMNNVPKPQPGTVYQMWLVSDSGATSAGTMDDKAVTPSTTAVLPDLGNSKALKFTVEPGTGSTQPTGQVVAELPLV